METVQQESSLKDLFKGFNEEIGKAGAYRQQLLEKQQEKHNSYHRDLTEYQELIELGEIEKAAEVDKRVRGLRKEVENLKAEISGIGDQTLDRLKEITAKHPEAKLHVLALAVHEKAIQELEPAQEGFNQAAEEVEEVKDSYLKAVEKLGNAQREVFNIWTILKKADEFLSVAEKVSLNKRPGRVLIWSELCIDEKALCKSFGRRPFN